MLPSPSTPEWRLRSQRRAAVTHAVAPLHVLILGALRARGPMSRSDLCIALSESKGRISRAVKALAGAGQLRSLGRGVWEVAS